VKVKLDKSAYNPSKKFVVQQPEIPQAEIPDDRFPGTFFRVPGVPLPGKTTWSLVK
jgi:hypothetical protein